MCSVFLTRLKGSIFSNKKCQKGLTVIHNYHCFDFIVPPNITHISANQTVNDGDNMTLHCSAEGFPAPNITWTRVSDNRVVMMPLTISTKDEGVYRCTATNNIGQPASADVFVTVQCEFQKSQFNLSNFLSKLIMTLLVSLAF